MDKRVVRGYFTSAELDRLEHDWWNSHADIVSQVWEMHDDISWTVRRRYMRKARQFLLDGEDSVVVLELGCGSGWVGQFIAGPYLRVLGTDSSESQIHLAQANASRRGLSAYCEYRVISSYEERVESSHSVDGVLIHCFLHHLSGREVEDILAGLRDHLKSGTKVWIYEPAFYPSSRSLHSRLSVVNALCLRVVSSLVRVLSWAYTKFDLVDSSIAQEFSSLTRQAEENGWYLSPKEVPFDVQIFSTQLRNYFEIADTYWGTVYSIGWVYESNILKDSTLRKLINRTIIPCFAFVDARLCREKCFLESRIIPPTYAFHVWECVVP